MSIHKPNAEFNTGGRPAPTLVPGKMPPTLVQPGASAPQTPARTLHDMTMMAKDVESLYILRTQLNTMYINEQITEGQFDKAMVITNARISHIRKLMAKTIDTLPDSGEFNDVAR